MPTATTEPVQLPPGPRIPKIVQFIVMLTALEHRWVPALGRRYGNTFTINLPFFGKTVVISDPILVKDIYSTSDDLIERPTSILGPVFGPGSTFSLTGKEHAERRKLVLPAFHGKRAGSYAHIVEEEVMRETASWPEGREFETLPTMGRLTLNAMRIAARQRSTKRSAPGRRSRPRCAARRGTGSGLGDWVLPEGTHVMVHFQLAHESDGELPRRGLVQPGPLSRHQPEALPVDAVRWRRKPLPRRGVSRTSRWTSPCARCCANSGSRQPMRPVNGVGTAVYRSHRHGAHARWCTGERPRRHVIVTLCRWPTTTERLPDAPLAYSPPSPSIARTTSPTSASGCSKH